MPSITIKMSITIHLFELFIRTFKYIFNLQVLDAIIYILMLFKYTLEMLQIMFHSIYNVKNVCAIGNNPSVEGGAKWLARYMTSGAKGLNIELIPIPLFFLFFPNAMFLCDSINREALPVNH